MKIAFFDIKTDDKDFLRKNLPDDQLHLFEEPFNEEIIQTIIDAEIISLRDRSKLSKEQSDKFSELKLIANRITGFDNIDKEIYADGKIKLCTVPAYGATTVAEYVFAHILNLSRKICKGIIKSDLKIIAESELCGIDLAGKTLGIIGTGKIGWNVAKIAKGFGMHLVGYDLHQNSDFEREYSLQYLDLDKLLESSDVISLNLPLTEATKYLINMDNIKKIKQGAIIVNTGRGGLIDARALVYALDNQIISAAGLDVLEDEDNIFEGKLYNQSEVDEYNTKLLKYDNVVITPHNAFNTKEAYERIMQTTVENIKAYKLGKPQNLVNLYDGGLDGD